jgi:hypothetical protein
MTIFRSEDRPPQAGPADDALAFGRAALSMVPLVGSPAVELLGLIVKPSLERRRDEWLTGIGERLRSLEEAKRLTLNDLQNDETFVDVATQATQAALRTSQSEKRRALRNAVLNSALRNAPEAVVQQLFVSLIDAFTEWHLKMLAFGEDTEAWLRGRTPDTLGYTRPCHGRGLARVGRKARRLRCNLVGSSHEATCHFWHTGIIRWGDSKELHDAFGKSVSGIHSITHRRRRLVACTD